MTSPWLAVAILAAGFGLKSLIDAVVEWRTEHPRASVPTNATYFKPCTGCTVKRTSKIGARVRTIVMHVRAFGRPVRGQTWWAGGRRSA